MFTLFFSLYYSMFTGAWIPLDNNDGRNVLSITLNPLGQFLTSLFNGVTTPMSDLGTSLGGTFITSGNRTATIWVALVAFILALITSIGIVVMAVKGVKKAFGIFFGQIR